MMHLTKFSPLESCLFNDERYITDGLFISANLCFSFLHQRISPPPILWWVKSQVLPFQQTKTTEIKEPIHIILTFLYTQMVVSGSCCLSEPFWTSRLLFDFPEHCLHCIRSISEPDRNRSGIV